MLDLSFREIYVALNICKLTLEKKTWKSDEKIGDLKTKVDAKFILFPMCIATP